jgi:hypothetical protein
MLLIGQGRLRLDVALSSLLYSLIRPLVRDGGVGCFGSSKHHAFRTFAELGRFSVGSDLPDLEAALVLYFLGPAPGYEGRFRARFLSSCRKLRLGGSLR